MAKVSQFTSVNGILFEGILLKDGTIDFNGVADAIILDANGDTTISASTDDQIDYKIGGAIDFTMTSNLFSLLGGSAVGGPSSTFMPLMPIVVQQDLSGAGAINVTSYFTAWTTTAADAGTMIDGVIKGQLKKVQLIVDGGDGILTPSNLNGGSTVTFADAGDYAIFIWAGSAWTVVELGNGADGVTAPVLA